MFYSSSETFFLQPIFQSLEVTVNWMLKLMLSSLKFSVFRIPAH